MDLDQNTINIGFSRQTIVHTWSWMFGSLLFGLVIGWQMQFVELSEFPEPLLFWFITFWIGGWAAVYAAINMGRLAFMYSGSPAMIISNKGITDQTTRKRFGFFIPWEDILSVESDMVRDYKYVFPGRYGRSIRAPQPHIFLLLRRREKYAPGSNEATTDVGKGPVYDIPCFQLDIPHEELLGVIEDRLVVHKNRYVDEGEEKYLASLYRLRGKGP